MWRQGGAPTPADPRPERVGWWPMGGEPLQTLISDSLAIQWLMVQMEVQVVQTPLCKPFIMLIDPQWQVVQSCGNNQGMAWAISSHPLNETLIGSVKDESPQDMDLYIPSVPQVKASRLGVWQRRYDTRLGSRQRRCDNITCKDCGISIKAPFYMAMEFAMSAL